MERRPVIGVATALERARWGAWDLPAHLLPSDYADAIWLAGGVPVLLPPDPEGGSEPVELLERIDGLVLAGGVDVDPGLYGAEPHTRTDPPCPARDRFELQLVRAALDLDMPVLGICRGMQILNVALGGSLHQDLPELHGHEEHRRVLGGFHGSDHQVELTAGSVAAAAAGETDHRTLSHHHQGVDRLGDGLVVTGRSDLDPTPEAIELPGRRFALGVQWHPEVDPDSRVIASFVRACAAG